MVTGKDRLLVYRVGLGVLLPIPKSTSSRMYVLTLLFHLSMRTKLLAILLMKVPGTSPCRKVGEPLALFSWCSIAARVLPVGRSDIPLDNMAGSLRQNG
jgi:hypothetical protein